MIPLHCWPHWLLLKSKGCPDTTIESSRRFQMSCKAFFSGKSPYITLSSENVWLKLEFIYLLYLNLAFFFTNLVIFLKLCNWRQFEVKMCEMTPSHNIRWPDVHWIWQQKVIFNLASKNNIVSNVKVSLKFYFLLLKLDPHNYWIFHVTVKSRLEFWIMVVFLLQEA